MSVKLESNLHLLDTMIKKLKSGLTHIARNGLDGLIREKVKELRDYLLFEINTNLKTNVASEKDAKSQVIEMAVSDQVILKEYGYDVSKMSKDPNSTLNFTRNLAVVDFIKNITDNSVESKNKDGKLIFSKVPTNPSDSVQDIYLRALKYFQDALYIDTTAGQPQYFSLTESGKNALADMQIKIRCSRFKGFDNPETIKRFGSQQARFGDYTTWALLKEDLDKLLDPKNGYSVNLNTIMDGLKEQDFESVAYNIKVTYDETIIKKFEAVSEGVQKNQVGLQSQAYFDLIKAIKNLELVIEKSQDGSSYFLQYNYEPADTLDATTAKTVNDVKSFISLWNIQNSELWYDHLKAKVERLIQDVNSSIS